jgi:DNA-binding LytR/AlgR family response regulator
VIFTTAYPQYALDGFDLNALDYLVKPISFERFMKAALKAKDYYELRERNQQAVKESKESYFFIKADNKLVKIFLADILFIEALQNYVTIHTVDRKFITYLTFKSVEEYLPSDQFLKTHKSYIVSASKIDSIEGNDILIGGHHVPVSRNQKDELMEKLLKGKFLKR